MAELFKKPSKAQVRNELEHDIEAFLRKGGEVTQVKMGASALVNGKHTEAPKLSFDEPKATRTPVPEVVAAIEHKRQSSRSKPTSKHSRRRQSRKRIIYDDFGEPIRELWVDE